MSRVLLDTHLLLWWLSDDPRLPTSLVTELQNDLHSGLIAGLRSGGWRSRSISGS